MTFISPWSDEQENPLDTHGFAFQRDPGVTDDLSGVLRNNDSDRIPLEYFPLVESLVKQKTGASKVVVFDHTVRRREADSTAKYDGEVKTDLKKAMQPAAMVHCDQSFVGSLRRIYKIMGAEASELLKNRAQIINVWRPLNGPVEDWPLAVMDGRSLKEENTHATNLFKHQYELQGQTVSISHSPEQRWYYLSHQRSDEVTFIKIWDSKEDVEAKICAHAAFQHPNTPANAVLRESIEVSFEVDALFTTLTLQYANGHDLGRVAYLGTNNMANDACLKNGEVVLGDLEYDGRVILYIIKADQTSYINYIKPLILARELGCPHVLSVIDTRDEWFYAVHPERMVPSLKDQDPETSEKVIVFESTACLQYLAERFDKDGFWRGTTVCEKGAVLSWTAYQTAALGPTAKYWLYFLRGYPTRQNPIQLPQTIQKLHDNVLKQWDIMEKRLSEPGQNYVALKERPTLADLSYFPFAMPWMFEFLGVDVRDWPHIEAWGKRMLERPAIKHILEAAPKYGHM
ncbi:hypothetical protein DHEL01_v210297 [Diaporthe helianthi]|uniref:GST C-terminal domain-containing protein n=1 Tax=Diaporthe helianthi TaxID=158607 RepID=A0A2P5HM39_DIAHE|nr:hypothetical protein DHEL01_v210297 [Diaporthe helianthi]